MNIYENPERALNGVWIGLQVARLGKEIVKGAQDMLPFELSLTEIQAVRT